MKVKNLYRDVTKRRYFKAFALSGRHFVFVLKPRAMPWARSFCPFRAYGHWLLLFSGRMGIGFCFFQGVLTKAGAWDFRHARFTSLTLPSQAFHNGHTWQ